MFVCVQFSWREIVRRSRIFELFVTRIHSRTKVLRRRISGQSNCSLPVKTSDENY